eukprot:TRINITY_DN2064_c0_g1_i3.p1 TRINITY_DN2064_c0_g1~~TRINITY_DN2064_c0_g1_i3.p1  ORF type:complete len:245 (+),score=61.88 TRINITY_DN2064_c0_g1_i3:82-816(+)
MADEYGGEDMTASAVTIDLAEASDQINRTARKGAKASKQAALALLTRSLTIPDDVEMLDYGTDAEGQAPDNDDDDGDSDVDKGDGDGDTVDGDKEGDGGREGDRDEGEGEGDKEPSVQWQPATDRAHKARATFFREVERLRREEKKIADQTEYIRVLREELGFEDDDDLDPRSQHRSRRGCIRGSRVSIVSGDGDGDGGGSSVSGVGGDDDDGESEIGIAIGRNKVSQHAVRKRARPRTTSWWR